MRKLIGMVVVLAVVPAVGRAQEKQPERPDSGGPSREELQWRVPPMGGRSHFRGLGLQGPMRFQGPLRMRQRMMLREPMIRMRERMALRNRAFRIPRMNVDGLGWDGRPRMWARAPRVHFRMPEMRLRLPALPERMRWDRWRLERPDGDDGPGVGRDEAMKLRDEMMALRGGMLRMKHPRYRPI